MDDEDYADADALFSLNSSDYSDSCLIVLKILMILNMLLLVIQILNNIYVYK
jgi:hypothetical protein